MNYKDIYFTERYGKIYEDNKEGKLVLYKYNDENGEVIYSFLKREISKEINGIKYYDIITPYGYGGPLILNSVCEEKLIENFFKDFNKYCEKERIVSEFVRFHPLLDNYKYCENNMEVSFNRETVYIPLESKKKIIENITSKCRNMIRKAEKNGIKIKCYENTEENLEIFYKLYTSTMDKNNADDYYYFSKEFFKETIKFLGDNVKFFNAIYEGKVISSAMIMKYGDFVHYHFSGSDINYRKLAANNKLLYEVALWGLENGAKKFHLGGGYGSADGPLYKFKKSFSKNGVGKFYIGKKIHNKEVYDQLVIKNGLEKEENDFFPLYRKKKRED